MGSLTILLMNKLNVWFRILANKINTVTLHPVNKYLSHFYRNYNNELNENISKTLIQKNILPTDPNKKLNLSYSIINLKPPD